MPEKRLAKILMIFLLMIASVSLVLAIYFLPPVHERLSWRVANLRAKIFYFFNPPGETAFSPGQQAEMEAIISMTQTAMVPDSTATLEPTVTQTVLVSPTPTQTPTPTPTATPIPDTVHLAGVTHEYQRMNNCGPATLSMALSFWGWEGDQSVTKPWLRPHVDDRNVMPYEMVDAVRQETNLTAILRSGGDNALIKKFIAAGFPIIIERDMSDVRPHKDWTGHYGVITGYDDIAGRFILQDSFISSDYPLSYEKFSKYWRAFNYVAKSGRCRTVIPG
jgi:hypothetical protein